MSVTYVMTCLPTKDTSESWQNLPLPFHVLEVLKSHLCILWLAYVLKRLDHRNPRQKEYKR